MYVLLLEDETHLAELLQRSLSSDGYVSSHITKLEEFDTYLSSQFNFEPDILIMENIIGGIDTGDRLKIISKKLPHTRVLVLTESKESRVRARILEQGADDCMSKPVHKDEFIARIHALVRRSQRLYLSQKISLHDLAINEESQDIEFEGKALKLNHKEFLIARAFIEHPNKVYNKFKLLDLAWDIQKEIESNVLESTITHLRRKFEKAKVRYKIQSRRNQGYWLEPI